MLVGMMLPPPVTRVLLKGVPLQVVTLTGDTTLGLGFTVIKI